MQIEVENLLKSYRGQAALQIDSLSVGSGERLGLVGNNGAGKTTLLRLILDLVRADEGRVRLNQKDVANDPSWRAEVGSYLDESFLIPFLTTEEYFEFVAGVYHVAANDLQESLQRFGRLFTEPVLGTGKYIRELSAGNQQKVGIVGAMIARPSLLVLDEPFANLDPSAQLGLVSLLESLAQEHQTTLVISSHNLEYVADLCDRIVVLEAGRIIRDSPRSDDSLADLKSYFGETD